MSEIGGVVGVIIWTSRERYPAMRDFYVDTLGLRPRSDRDGFVNFEWGDVRLTVAVHSEVVGQTVDPLRMMVNLGVEDIEATAAALRSKGVHFLRSPEREHWGGLVATLTDPDGNLIQLLAP